jgi:hypothetical protein
MNDSGSGHIGDGSRLDVSGAGQLGASGWGFASDVSVGAAHAEPETPAPVAAGGGSTPDISTVVKLPPGSVVLDAAAAAALRAELMLLIAAAGLAGPHTGGKGAAAGSGVDSLSLAAGTRKQQEARLAAAFSAYQTALPVPPAMDPAATPCGATGSAGFGRAVSFAVGSGARVEGTPAVMSSMWPGGGAAGPPVAGYAISPDL